MQRIDYSVAAHPAADLRGAADGLRLALFSGNYNYTRDGANQALNRLVGFLLAAGGQVRVYAPTSRTPAFPPVGELVSVPSLPLPGRADYRLGLGLPRRIRDDIARFAPTAVHLSAPDLIGWSAQALGRRLGVPVVASLHTRFEAYLDYYGLGALAGLAERRLTAFYGGCDRVLAPNTGMAELLVRQGLRGRVGIWGRGVDRSLFSPDRRDLGWRQAAGLADDDLAVLFLGRLVREKGLDVFAHAVQVAAASDRRVKAVVVGDGPAGAWFRKRLPAAVFTGELCGPALGRAVASADVLLAPSRTEAFGNVVLEAMAAGLVVLAPEAPSTSSLIRNGREGLLRRDPTADDYVGDLATLAASPGLRRQLGQAARAASAAHDWDGACAAALDTYRELGALG